MSDERLVDGEIEEPDPSDAEIVPAEQLVSGGGAAALTAVLDQSRRDASANRAQARELVRALEQVRDAHEYMGRALRDEQRRSRRLIFALAVVPILAAALVYVIWNHVDSIGGDLRLEVASLRDGRQEALDAERDAATEAAAKAHAERVSALDADLVRVQEQLAASRAGLAAERRTAAEREAGMATRMERLERDSAEAAGLRAKINALQASQGADAARADELEREVRRLTRELGRQEAEETAASHADLVNDLAASEANITGPELNVDDADRDEAIERANDRAERHLDGAVTTEEDVERVRTELNRLLESAGDGITYRFDSLGGIRGDELLDVRVVGAVDGGGLQRILESKTVRLTVQGIDDTLRLDFEDGHLLLGGYKAPFFDGRYALSLSTDAEAWRISSLTCVAFER